MSGIVGTGGALTMAADCVGGCQGGCQGGMALRTMQNYHNGPDHAICHHSHCKKDGCPATCPCKSGGVSGGHAGHAAG